MKSFPAVLLIFLFGLGAVTSCASAGDRATMPFLRLGVGGQEIAMGGAGVSFSEGASSLYWNPAGLAASDNLEVRLTHTEWFQGFRHEFAAVSRRWKDTGFAFGFLSMYADKLEKYDDLGVYEGEFGYYDLALMAGAGRTVNEKLDAGLTAKLIRGSIDSYSATGFAVDLGIKYRPGPPGLTAGAAIQNIGTGITYISKADPLPRLIQVGASYELAGPLEGSRVLSALDIRKPADDGLQLHAGVELALQSGLSFRLGYKGGYENENISTGVGFTMRKMSLDYAFEPFYSDLGSTHRITFGYTE